MTERKTIGFIGLGAMGARMAAHLLEAHDVRVHNRTKARAAALVEAGAAWASTPREAAEGADLVVVIVTDDEAAEQVWLDPERGALAGMAEGALAIESSTVTPGFVARLARAAGAAGVRLLDAPVAGSTPQAEARQLVHLVGGAADDLAEAEPVLALMGAKRVHAGPSGHGARLKLLVNAAFATQVALMAELLGAAAATGADPAAIHALLAAMPVTSPAAAAAGALMVAGDHAPRFPVDLVAKDLRYASGLGDTPLVRAALERYERASEAGHGGENLTAVHRLYAE
jgi:3-hydroxyisobutyrate dehydrogenase-like beta-hydroxyacid dehydrogenase